MTAPAKFWTVVPSSTSITYTSVRYASLEEAELECLTQTLVHKSPFVIMVSAHYVEHPLNHPDEVHNTVEDIV